MNNLSKLKLTRSCTSESKKNRKNRVDVGDFWFIIEHVYREKGEKPRLLVVVPNDDSSRFLGRSHPIYVNENERIQLRENIFATFTNLAKNSHIELLLEADRMLTINKF